MTALRWWKYEDVGHDECNIRLEHLLVLSCPDVNLMNTVKSVVVCLVAKP